MAGGVSPGEASFRMAEQKITEIEQRKKMEELLAAAPKPPSPPTTEERAKGITEAARETELKRRARTGRQSTILTSALGTVGQARTGRKTLLGQ